MKLLLDTHLLLWTLAGSPRLSGAAKTLICDPANELIFSVASVLEVAIKHAKGLPTFQAEPTLFRNSLLLSGFNELDVLGRHAIAISTLPPIHKDPFDRLLIVQSIIEAITLVTVDAVIAKYPGPIRKV